MYDFITVGGATHDISFLTDKGILINNHRDILRQKLLGFEYGAKIKVDKFRYSFGGGAANAAVALANFSLRVACLATVGGDESGRLILKNLHDKKVATNLMSVVKSEGSGSSFILIAPSGERIIFAARGANRHLIINTPQLTALKKVKNIYIASLSGDWLNNLKKIFSLVGSNGPKIYWNPGASQYSGGLKKIAPFLKKTTVFALNKDEAIELVMSSQKHKHLNSSFLNNTDNLLRAIKEFGPEIVVITLGSEGVKVYDGKKIYFHAVLKEKKRVDTTGVGDVFNSSFSAGLVLYQGDINKALHLGLKNTTAKIAHFGAQNGLIKLKK
jgi:sugar/nucleoside kinase (ribokinase family)